MASQKIGYSVTVGKTAEPESKTIRFFILKSVGAALCGAAIPAVVFYFLF